MLIQIAAFMNNISISEFNQLTTDEKAWHLWHGAVFLHVVVSDGYRVNLFYFNDFYIELWYNVSENKVDHIRAFKSVKLLTPFLENISLGNLADRI